MRTETELTTEREPRSALCGRPSLRQLIWAGLFMVSIIAGSVALRHLALPAWARYLIPSVPILIGLEYIRTMLSDMRRQMDELQLRIYLEAMVAVVSGLFIFLTVYPLLQSAGIVGALDYTVVLMLMFVLGIAGYVVARRRYR